MTKAKTKAEKLRVKRDRGRPRLEVVYREPNGRRSRAAEPADMVAVEARAKMLGLSVIEAKDPLACSFIGRLFMQHKAWEKNGSKDSRRPIDSLTERQHDAAVKYRELHNNYLKAVGAPGAIYDTRSLGGGDEEAHAKWVTKVKADFSDVRKVILMAQGENRMENLLAALDYCILRDEPMVHMIGALRILLNAMAHHWKMG